MELSVVEQRVRDALAAAVEERGEDWVYPSDPSWRDDGLCRYQLDDGTPACIVGVAARKIDPEIDMPRADANPLRVIARALGLISDDMGEFLPLRRDYDVLERAVNEAQVTQDDGYTWGEALAKFDKVLNDA